MNWLSGDAVRKRLANTSGALADRFRRLSFPPPLIALAIGLVSLVVGASVSAAALPAPKIGVVHVDITIQRFFSPYFTIPLDYAAEHPEVVAVVLLIDSPGGEATVSEELFYRVVELRQDKPVVASIDRLGASGAYYIAIGANYIYAKPAALVGSIGVRAGLPRQVPPDEDSITSGPFKGSGSSEIDWIRAMDMIKETFVTNVHDQRLYALENLHQPSRAHLLPDKAELATGEVWIAPLAYDIGLVDALGSNRDAIRKAAELARVSNYEVIDLTYLVFLDDPTFIGVSAPPDLSSLNFAHWASGGSQESYIEGGQWPTFEHLYLPPSD